MRLSKVILPFFFCCFLFTVSAQETWSLERCIQVARENNITVKQSQASVRLAHLSEQQAKASRLPNVSASLNAGEQFGRTIDPTSNSFSNTAIGFNSVGLSAGVNVFSGGQIHHAVKQAGWERRAAEADAEQLVTDLSLQVAQAYLNILLAQEQVESAARRTAQSRDQLSNTLKLISAGTLPPADRYNIDALIARNEQLAVTAQNSLELGYLALKQLLQLDPDFPMQVDRPGIQVPAETAFDSLALTPLYNTALGTQASIRSGDFRLHSAEEGISVAKAAYWPTVSLFASLSSNYSTAFQTPIFGANELVTQTVQINGQDIDVGFYQPTVTYRNLGYLNQIDQNFGQTVGVNVNIPIYQNGRTRLSVERARLNLLTTEMQNTQTRQRLRNDIQTALANAKAGRKQLDAAQKSYDASQAAYVNTEKRHQIGVVNTLELTTARSNLDIAESDLLVAKYDYLFRLKILDFYQGKPLSM